MTTADSLRAFQSMVDSVNTYPVEAFLFVRDGLHAAATTLHGEESATHQKIQEYLQQEKIDDDLMLRAYVVSGQVLQVLVAALLIGLIVANWRMASSG